MQSSLLAAKNVPKQSGRQHRHHLVPNPPYGLHATMSLVAVAATVLLLPVWSAPRTPPLPHRAPCSSRLLIAATTTTSSSSPWLLVGCLVAAILLLLPAVRLGGTVVHVL